MAGDIRTLLLIQAVFITSQRPNPAADDEMGSSRVVVNSKGLQQVEASTGIFALGEKRSFTLCA